MYTLIYLKWGECLPPLSALYLSTWNYSFISCSCLYILLCVLNIYRQFTKYIQCFPVTGMQSVIISFLNHICLH